MYLESNLLKCSHALLVIWCVAKFHVWERSILEHYQLQRCSHHNFL